MNCIICGEKLVEREYQKEGESATDYILKKTYFHKGKCKGAKEDEK